MNKKTLVRGPDGSLYLLTENAPPLKLTPEETKRVEEIFQGEGEALGKAVDAALPRICLGGSHNLHIAIPEVFMD